MKLLKWPSLILFVLVNLNAFCQAIAPLAISQVDGIKELVLKEDYESLKTVLLSEDFTFDKADFNYSDGNKYYFCKLFAYKNIGVFVQKANYDQPYHCKETLSISYYDDGLSHILNIQRNFVSNRSSSISIIWDWSRIPWTKISSNYFQQIEGEKVKNDLYGSFSKEIPSSTVKSFLEANEGGKLDCTYESPQGEFRHYSLWRQNFNNDFWIVPPDTYTYSIEISERFSKNKLNRFSGPAKVPLIRSGKIYFITVQIGGLRKKYILDTGASEVAIDEETLLSLFQSGLITTKDFLPSKEYSLANGSIKSYKRVLLPLIKVGDVEAKNIEAYIVRKGEPLLLGKSFLDAFKTWKIDNTKNHLILSN